MTATRIYLVGSSDPALPVSLVRATSRQQALSHIASTLFEVRVATQDDLIQQLSRGATVANAKEETQE